MPHSRARRTYPHICAAYCAEPDGSLWSLAHISSWLCCLLRSSRTAFRLCSKAIKVGLVPRAFWMQHKACVPLALYPACGSSLGITSMCDMVKHATPGIVINGRLSHAEAHLSSPLSASVLGLAVVAVTFGGMMIISEWSQIQTCPGLQAILAENLCLISAELCLVVAGDESAGCCDRNMPQIAFNCSARRCYHNLGGEWGPVRSSSHNRHSASMTI